MSHASTSASEWGMGMQEARACGIKGSSPVAVTSRSLTWIRQLSRVSRRRRRPWEVLPEGTTFS